MAFPNLTPTSRSFESGDYPVKTFKSQNGAEVRILYGDKRTNMKLSLSYANITDAEAEQFLDHFDEVQGTLKRSRFRLLLVMAGQATRMHLERKPMATITDMKNRLSSLRCDLGSALLQ